MAWGRLYVFLFALLSVASAAPPTCQEVGQFTPCKALLNYTNTSVTGNCQDDQEFLINSTAWIWALVGEKCRNALAQYMCVNTYPPCSGLKPCQSMCLKLTAECETTELLHLTYQSVDGAMGGIMDCTKLNTTNCYEPPEEMDELPVPTAHCENYTGTICANWIGYPVYIPFGWTQAKLEDTAKQVTGILGLVDQTCRDSMGKWACHQAFMPCNDSQVADILQLTLTHNPAYPSFPCQSTCQTYLRDCADYVGLDPRLQANCSGFGTFAGGQQCGIPSSVEDWPAEANVLGVINGQLLETPCNNYEQTSSAQVSCFLPFVKPDGPNGGIIRRFFPDSTCDLPCPASFLFSEDQWDTLTNAMGISYISFFLNLFLAVTWKSFQQRKSQVYVARFLTLTTILSGVLCLGFWAIPSHAPKRDLRYLQCADNVSSYPMGFNFCTFQAISIYWLTLSLAGWWFIIGFDAYRSAVLDEKLSHDQAKRKRMHYHILGWGLPSFSLFLFLACGGKLGGDNETALVFCFVGNRSIRETGEWLDYFTFFMPLMVYMLCGCYFITRISLTTIKSSRKTRNPKSQQMLLGQIVRMATFLSIFLFVFGWVFTYRVGISEYRDPLIMAGFKWAKCHFETLGNFAICGERPVTDLSFDAQLGFHVVLAMSGIWVFLVWGTDRKVYVDWKSRLQNATWKDLVLCKPVRDKYQQNNSHTPSNASGTGTGSGTQQVDPMKSSELHTDDEFTSTSTDAVPTMHKSMSVIMPEMLGWRRFIAVPYWTQLVTIPKIKKQVRRYKVAMFALLVFLFFLILLIALLSDKSSNATFELPTPLALNLGKKGKSLPAILIQSVEFLALDFYALEEDRTHIDSVVRVTTNNPCGKFCPITVESMSLSMNLMLEGLSVGWMRNPGKIPVKLIQNPDKTYDPVVFDAEVVVDIMLEMSGGTAAEWDEWESLANATWDHYNETAPFSNETWRRDPACAELSDSRGCATYGCRWVGETCEGPSLMPELVPVRPGSPKNMIKMMGQFLAQPNVTLGLHGLAATRAFKLDIGDIGINLNTVVKASDGLRAQIFLLDIPSNAPGGGLTLNVDMNVINPSVGSIPEIGDMVFEIRSGAVVIGEMFVPNSTLFSGDNLLSGSGVIWPKDSVAKAECEKMMSSYLSGATQYLTAVGLGQHPRSRYPVKWFGDLVSTMTLTIPMTGRLVNAMSNVTIDRVTFDFRPASNPQAEMVVSSKVNFPFKFPMTLQSVDVDYVLQLEANIAIESATYGNNCACLPPSCICATVGEDEMLDLRCPLSTHVISTFLFASYGEPTGTCGQYVSGSCDATDTLSLLSARCKGSRNCTIPNATDTLTPHSCNDTAVAKRLYVNVRCATAVNVGTVVTPYLQSRCNGTDNCEVVMSVATLGPDPFIGCAKVLNVSFRCTNPKYGLLYRTSLIATSSPLYNVSAILDCDGPAFASTSAQVGLNPPIPLVDGQAMITMAANNSFTVLNSTLFGEYVVDIVTGAATVRSIVGKINATAQTVIGEFMVSGLQLNTQFFVAGMKGFPGLSITKLDVTGGRSGELDLMTTNAINNTASITAFMGQVGFTIWYKNINCGNITHSGLTLYPAMNSVTMPGFYAEKSPVCQELLSNYLNVQTSSVQLKGESSLTANQYLKLAFTPALVLNAIFPGMALPRMIIKTYTSNVNIFTTSLDARLRVENRFSSQILITRVSQTLYKAGSSSKIGTIDDNRGSNPLSLAPQQQSVTSTVPVDGTISWSSVVFIFNGGGNLDITGTIGISIGGYSATLPYSQNTIPAVIDQSCIDNLNNCN